MNKVKNDSINILSFFSYDDLIFPDEKRKEKCCKKFKKKGKSYCNSCPKF